MRRSPFTLHSLTAALFCVLGLLPARAQDDSMRPTDGGGTGVLESIYVPNLPNAPFSLVLHTEWVHAISNGGTMTLVNKRPIVRDGAGRIYQERWLLMPKGSDMPSQMTTVQIDDPVAHIFYQCYVHAKVCELHPAFAGLAHYDATKDQSGPLKSGKGTYLHEDLGPQTYAGMPVHEYRDTTTIDAGALGNDVAMATVREFRYSADLGFNLTSMLDDVQHGRQIFTVSELSTGRLQDRRQTQTSGTGAVRRVLRDWTL